MNAQLSGSICAVTVYNVSYQSNVWDLDNFPRQNLLRQNSPYDRTKVKFRTF